MTRLAAAAALTLVAGLAGCSSDADPPVAAPVSAPADPAPGSSTSPTSPPARTATPAAPTAAAPGGASPRSDQAVISIKGFAFTGPQEVAPGASVSVRNRDLEAHTVTADQGSAFDTKVDGGGRAKTSFHAPGKPGRYRFHCAYHADMDGVLVVR